MKTIIVLIVTILSSTLGLNAQSSTNTETQKIVDEFFKTYKRKGHAEAIYDLLGTNTWNAGKSAENVSAKLTDLMDQIGEYYGYEKINESTYGTSVIQYTYLVKYERQPIKFQFRFYRPDKKWKTQGFEFEVDFLDELNETPKTGKLQD
jgi:hypothetical protein